MINADEEETITDELPEESHRMKQVSTALMGLRQTTNACCACIAAAKHPNFTLSDVNSLVQKLNTEMSELERLTTVE